MVNYIMKFVPHLAEKTKPLRDLLLQDQAWQWTKFQQNAFEQLKKELTNEPTLILYDVNAPNRISADASSFGLSAILEQYKKNKWKPVSYASRSLTKTECRYAQIEKEALSITWACNKFKNYILGKQCEILTDHKP